MTVTIIDPYNERKHYSKVTFHLDTNRTFDVGAPGDSTIIAYTKEYWVYDDVIHVITKIPAKRVLYISYNDTDAYEQTKQEHIKRIEDNAKMRRRFLK